MPEIPSFILERAQTQKPIFDADEVATWPAGLLNQLVTDDVLIPTSNATSVACDACGDDHVELVQFIEAPPGSELRAYIACPENGRVRVPLDRLRCWVVNLEKVRSSNDGEPAGSNHGLSDKRVSPQRNWPHPKDHTTAKIWTRKNGVLCLSTKTDAVHDGEVEFAPIVAGELTYQMRFMQFMCFKFPDSATLVEVIAQVYPDDLAEAEQDPEILKKTLRKLRSLVSDVRTKKIAKAGLNPNILPPLSVEASIDAGIGLRLAHLHRLDDKELDEADAAPE